MSDLKLCPFCGSSAEVSESGGKARCADDFKTYCDASERWFDADWWETRREPIAKELVKLFNQHIELMSSNYVYYMSGFDDDKQIAIEKRLCEIEKDLTND